MCEMLMIHLLQRAQSAEQQCAINQLLAVSKSLVECMQMLDRR